ncbi:AraC family transcriptional regulator [Acinetobacter sp. S40]|uniref:AraC family transcriptional regulator n=1 Tax=Acinetobacter sp. S40 TaxID=2767434 RepID=UPI00190BDA0A|nr:AraC family transcriptional regulator [Acinetobacter sp. S40]MBJ9985076.1 AraC family transcriptional regulator [Acinetobacter sp. S40]
MQRIAQSTIPPSNKGTISIALVNEALSVAHTRGLNIEKIAQQAGISSELLHFPKARIPVSAYAQLWIELANHMNDEFFGMDSHPMRRGSYQLLAKLAMQSETLKKALIDILKYFSVLLDDIHAELHIEQSIAHLIISDKDHPKRMFSYATFLMLIHGLLCWLADQRIAINKITLKCSKPTYPQDYYVRFCENIEFDAEFNRIEFNADYLQIKIKKDKKALTEFLKQTPQNLLVRYKNENSLSLIIRRHLIQHPPIVWPELKELSQQLYMSEATIQRRLKAENISYQQLKNDIRCDIAIERLSKTEDSIQEISHALNFHDASAFYRAFKKWTGVNPSAYRQNTPVE